jgi:lysophospholipase L1-like esterase
MTSGLQLIVIYFFLVAQSLAFHIPAPFLQFFFELRLSHPINDTTMPIPQVRRKILLLGSSTTQRSFSVEHHGWGAQLAHWYSRTADVLNRGAGGYNSRWTKRYLKRSFAGEKPDMTIVFIGNNDSIQENEPQHVPLTEYRDNLISILDFLYQVNRNMIVLMVTTSRVNEELRPKHNNERRNQYAQVVREIVANRWDLPIATPKHLALVDLQANDAFQIRNDDLNDGMHFNRSGNHKVFEAIKAVINANFPHFSPDHVPSSSAMKAAKQSSRRARGDTFGDLSTLKEELPQPPPLVRKSSLENTSIEEQLVTEESTLGIGKGSGQTATVSQEDAPLQMTVPYWNTLV